MNRYLITYDLHRPVQDYPELFAAIKSLGAWWHYLGSVWIVKTTLTATQIADHLRLHHDDDDSVLVIGVTAEMSGWLPKDAWAWLYEAA